MAEFKNTTVAFTCRGTAVGRMRNELDVRMIAPGSAQFDMATDEGEFHGGDGTAPYPLALFIGGLTACLMTQVRAFAKRLRVHLDDLTVDAKIVWDLEVTGRTYETAPRSIELDVAIESPDPEESIVALIEAAKKGCFIEQTLGRVNTIKHRYKTADGWKDV